MEKKTFEQSIKLVPASDSEKVALFIEYGFSQAEAELMVQGPGLQDAYARLGGVWKVGNVEWWQAISKGHALKLHIWNFGAADTSDVTLVKRDEQGVTWVISQ